MTNGKNNLKKYIVVHETDNTNIGADADAHARLQITVIVGKLVGIGKWMIKRLFNHFKLR